jgi:hypothetical protein
MDADMARSPSVHSANVSWNWRQALFGAVVSVIGATVIALGQVHTGLGLLFGALPAAIVGLGPAAAATNASRWYVTPAFTAFLVFWALLYGKTGNGDIERRFLERVLETILGVGIAYFFGLLIPWIRTKATTRTAGAP